MVPACYVISRMLGRGKSVVLKGECSPRQSSIHPRRKEGKVLKGKEGKDLNLVSLFAAGSPYSWRVLWSWRESNNLFTL